MQGFTFGKTLITEMLQERFGDCIDVTELLTALYAQCAIGVIGPQSRYRARYLYEEEFYVRKGEQLMFHPSLAIKLNLGVSIWGNTAYREYGDESEDLESIPAQ